ncbi:hypothetical protein DFH11DRAFT_1874733 [Phellopilus nigrolimitatus]|nr:hypothetical protein DFH11DRAFT_1874733 [Phellopilus nigrolimitatus]
MKFQLLSRYDRQTSTMPLDRCGDVVLLDDRSSSFLHRPDIQGLLLCQAYIPAQATNDTAAVQAGVNQSDTSTLKLQWFPNASLTETVSYQLVGADTTGINKLLYSEWSDACLINPAYADSATFDHVFDIFFTGMCPNKIEKLTSLLIHVQDGRNSFVNVDQSLYGDFNAWMLNQTFNVINTSIQTGQVHGGDTGDNGSNSANPGSTGSSNTNLAMQIIMPSIIGIV